jgi:hypothetical protein
MGGCVSLIKLTLIITRPKDISQNQADVGAGRVDDDVRQFLSKVVPAWFNPDMQAELK